jgi:hypothetical protein
MKINPGGLFKLLSFVNTDEKQTAVLANNILSNDTHSLDLKLLTLYAVMSSSKQLKNLCHYILGEFKHLLGNQALQLKAVLKSILVNGYEHDEAGLDNAIRKESIIAFLSTIQSPAAKKTHKVTA